MIKSRSIPRHRKALVPIGAAEPGRQPGAVLSPQRHHQGDQKLEQRVLDGILYGSKGGLGRTGLETARFSFDAEVAHLGDIARHCDARTRNLGSPDVSK